MPPPGSFSARSTPTAVRNEIGDVANSFSNSTWALARVACPQISTSTVGVNHRRPTSPVVARVETSTKAVSETFTSAATACIQTASSLSVRHTPAGLPAKGTDVKASTRKSCTDPIVPCARPRVVSGTGRRHRNRSWSPDSGLGEADPRGG